MAEADCRAARSSAKRGLTFVLNTASKVPITEGSADHVKKTHKGLAEEFEVFKSLVKTSKPPWEMRMIWRKASRSQ